MESLVQINPEKGLNALARLARAKLLCRCSCGLFLLSFLRSGSSPWTPSLMTRPGWLQGRHHAYSAKEGNSFRPSGRGRGCDMQLCRGADSRPSHARIQPGARHLSLASSQQWSSSSCRPAPIRRPYAPYRQRVYHSAARGRRARSGRRPRPCPP